MLARTLLLLACALAARPSAAASFLALGLRGSQLSALSADGRSATGSVVGAASGGFLWHEGHGAELLPGALSARGISASGRYVAGSALDRNDHEVAAWWDGSNTPHRIGGLPGAAARAGVLSRGVAVSDDGRVVGTANDREDHDVAFSWTQARGLHALPLDAAGASSVVIGLSDDGERAFGWRSTPSARLAVVWHGREERAITIPSDCTDPRGASRDATILLGLFVSGADPAPCAWNTRTHSAKTLAGSTTLPSPLEFTAIGDDGALMAGSAGSGGRRVAIVRSERGVEMLSAFLAARHVAVPQGWNLSAATAISADGCRIGGYGQHDGAFDSFVADVCPDAPASRAAAASRLTSTAPRRRPSPSSLPEKDP